MIHPMSWFLFSFSDRVSLCNAGHSRTHPVDYAGLEIGHLPLSAGIKGVYGMARPLHISLNYADKDGARDYNGAEKKNLYQ